MELLGIATTEEAKHYFTTKRTVVNVIDDLKRDKFLTNVAAVVLMDSDSELVDQIDATDLDLPIFMVLTGNVTISDEVRHKVYHFINNDADYAHLYDSEIEDAAQQYEKRMTPPFLSTLIEYAKKGKLSFTTPGHHAGEAFKRHPAGRWYTDWFGENIFRSDLSCSDIEVGDILTHGGAPLEAEQHAAKVFNADKTYFCTNGTSTSNSIVTNAAIAPGDLVLFDRNNHKSMYISALEETGGIPIYLQTERNPYGFIGGISDSTFNEKHIRELIAQRAPGREKEARPFRLAVIELGTYDGCISNAKDVIDRIGHLCDYIHFDSAWVGYEEFIPIMQKSSPLLLDLGPDDPGIFVTQSVHKQQSGFSQASQIHKKDKHIKGQHRYIPHKRFNNSYMKFTSTSPFYPMYASMDVNAYMNEGKHGRKMWHEVVKLGIYARKRLLKESKMFVPFIPPVVNGQKWQDADTEEIAGNIAFWAFEPGAKWHAFDDFGKDQYYIDPLKLLIRTPGIDIETGEYEEFGIPANILHAYLRSFGIVPEKSDLNSIEFLITAAETETKIDNLINSILRFEKLVEENAPLQDVLPNVYEENRERYRGYRIKDLCKEMHDFYKKHNTKHFQKALFKEESYLPQYAMSPIDADKELIRGNCELVPVDKIEGRVALEGGLPYPPGIFVIAPGERWSHAVCEYFLILQDGISNFPGFTPEIQGVYNEPQPDGKVRAYGYVLKDESVIKK